MKSERPGGRSRGRYFFVDSRIGVSLLVGVLGGGVVGRSSTRRALWASGDDG